MSDAPEIAEVIYKAAQSEKSATICWEKKNLKGVISNAEKSLHCIKHTDWFV